MIAPLSAGQELVLAALNEPGSRWHHFEELSERTGLTLRATRSALADLRRRDFAVRKAQLGRGSAEWSTTTLGVQLHEHIKKTAPRREDGRGHDTEEDTLTCTRNV